MLSEDDPAVLLDESPVTLVSFTDNFSEEKMDEIEKTEQHEEIVETKPEEKEKPVLLPPPPRKTILPKKDSSVLRRRNLPRFS